MYVMRKESLIPIHRVRIINLDVPLSSMELCTVQLSAHSCRFRLVQVYSHCIHNIIFWMLQLFTIEKVSYHPNNTKHTD